jgi:hypothetical protein
MQLLRGYDADVRKNNGLRRVASEADGLAGGYDSAAFDVSTQPGPSSMHLHSVAPAGRRSSSADWQRRRQSLRRGS